MAGWLLGCTGFGSAMLLCFLGRSAVGAGRGWVDSYECKLWEYTPYRQLVSVNGQVVKAGRFSTRNINRGRFLIPVYALDVYAVGIYFTHPPTPWISLLPQPPLPCRNSFIPSPIIVSKSFWNYFSVSISFDSGGLYKQACKSNAIFDRFFAAVILLDHCLCVHSIFL